jgi:hypothetical protein
MEQREDLGRAVGLGRRLSPGLAKDSLSGGLVVGARLLAPMAESQGSQALGVEAGDQVRDGVAGASAGRAGGLLVVAAGGDGQEDPSPGDLDGQGDLEAAELGQGDRSSSVRTRSGPLLRRDMAASVRRVEGPPVLLGKPDHGHAQRE